MEWDKSLILTSDKPSTKIQEDGSVTGGKPEIGGGDRPKRENKLLFVYLKVNIDGTNTKR